MYMLVGTYTNGSSSKGIYVYKIDIESGESKYISMTEIENPSYLTYSLDEKFVYAVTETGDLTTASANSFSFDKQQGTLKFLNKQLTQGEDPCYIIADKVNRHLVTANYTGGSVTAFTLSTDGSIDVSSKIELLKFQGSGPDPRQKSPHLHCVVPSPGDGKYVYAMDLGSDRIHKFITSQVEKSQFLKPEPIEYFQLSPGSGPRHMEFHPSGKYAYLLNELSGTVVVFQYVSDNGDLVEIQSLEADEFHAQGSADIHCTPDGKFLYTSHRLKGDGISIFSINSSDGKLTKIGYQPTGIHPRNFIITPNGKYLLVANRDSNQIQIFQINNTGILNNINKDIQLEKPVCLKFLSIK
ncbi:hypothetical protein DLAC_10280 [Tieghemostelium lacteum]|uniref:6-phosphogluconolactonase n=1 Tax=Tieghemostelium lacteum TaxID=361077 RepID=A0A151Z5I0_TIELA|nr:hypothetical protein DLAC_10280 [Tieghemostelium lacteum]|eukprot:KYQ89054.1 hypothetical protein DLAC_10280 [Tieghemostelium lacteum]